MNNLLVILFFQNLDLFFCLQLNGSKYCDQTQMNLAQLLITWRRPEVKRGRNVYTSPEKNNKKTTKMRTKVRNKIDTQIKKPHFRKGFPTKTRTISIKMDLALNNLQRLICHKTQKTNKQ